MSFANGLANGVNMGIRLSQAKDYEDRQKVLRERDELAYNREEAQRAALEQANAAARKAFEEHRSAFEAASQPKTEERVTLMTKGDTQPSLGTASLGDGAPMPDVQLGGQQRPAGLAGSLSLGGGGGTPIPREQVQVQPAVRYDEREGVLAGLSARRKALMSANVDSKLWMDDWAKESALRSQMRGERIDAAERRFMSTGDPGEYAKAIYPLIDDGMEFVGTEPVKTQDGSQAWKFIRRDSQTGKEISSVMNAEQFQKFMLGVRDPAKVAEYESKSLLERMEADEKIRAEIEKQKAVRQTKTHESGLRLEEIAAQGKQNRQTIAARGAEDRRTDDGAGQVKPRDMVAALDSERKDLRDRQQALFKEYQQNMKDAETPEERAAVRQAYDRMSREIDTALSDLDQKRKRLSERIGLGAPSTPARKPSLSLGGTSAPPTVTNW